VGATHQTPSTGAMLGVKIYKKNSTFRFLIKDGVVGTLFFRKKELFD
jgi:hypothetical protein